MNRVRRALREGKVVLGTMLTEFKGPEVVRIMAAAGFDFVFIDAEHSTYSLEAISDIVRVCKGLDLACLVRVADPEYHLIARTLDAGAQGLMVPRVETPEVVRAIVQAAKYPPLGERGFGPRGIVTDYREMSVRERMEAVNEDTVIVLQIERKRAIENIDQMVSVRGVDAALIGPNDLSISLGVPGEHGHPLMVEAIQRVVDACRRHGAASGIHIRDMEKLLFWRERGMTLLTYSTDTAMIMEAATGAVKRLREGLGAQAQNRQLP